MMCCYDDYNSGEGNGAGGKGKKKGVVIEYGHNEGGGRAIAVKELPSVIMMGVRWGGGGGGINSTITK